MSAAFVDSNLNAQIEAKGFAVVPFADLQQLEELKFTIYPNPTQNHFILATCLRKIQLSIEGFGIH